MAEANETASLAARLAREAGRAAPLKLDRLAGGKNNRVYLITHEDGASTVLKSYFHDARDTRDRLQAEWSFLQYAWARDVRVIPEPLAQASDAHAALYSFLPGRKLASGEPGARHVAAALDFIVATNARAEGREALPPGSEACFSLGEHIARVEARLARLATLAADAPHRLEAERFVTNELAPAWRAIRARIERHGGDASAALTLSELIASPSDIGFHNALVDDDGTLRFFDFEYAGRDDPAKLCGDFFCCPEIPTPIDQFDAFVDGLCTLLALGDKAAQRARLLLDAYRIKWTCIILNDFLPVDEARRAFALPEERGARCAAQLDKARAKLAEVTL